ncbi:juvenile hormone acid O-methyltransferase-like [Photinus pyralis]|uniref:Methyltransferase domain-containing protein n=2 Tax=Photinus pyralis TaxID=7054 RepID=A0A1Y1MW06_PHOPY|nr:juvenile hormone acid O-methyltransferase-like [Photinus pyralis]
MSTSTSLRFVKHVLIIQKDGKYFMEKIQKLITWKTNCTILDVGCGPGNVTHDFLLPTLPNQVRIVAIDKSADAIRYANEHYGRSPIAFLQMDVVSPAPQFREYFDYIVSFYCLHFIGEQQSALKNIYQMLKPGGDFFFTCVVQCDLFQVIATIFDDPKWRPYTSDNRQYMSPYQYSPHYIGDLERMLREVGFDVSFIAAEPREYDYPMRSVGDVLLSVYSMNISKHLEGEFEIVARRAIREVGCSRIKGGEEFYHTKFQVLFGHARRPTGG